MTSSPGSAARGRDPVPGRGITSAPGVRGRSPTVRARLVASPALNGWCCTPPPARAAVRLAAAPRSHWAARGCRRGRPRARHAGAAARRGRRDLPVPARMLPGSGDRRAASAPAGRAGGATALEARPAGTAGRSRGPGRRTGHPGGGRAAPGAAHRVRPFGARARALATAASALRQAADLLTDLTFGPRPRRCWWRRWP
jgi:hypothetical protein